MRWLPGPGAPRQVEVAGWAHARRRLCEVHVATGSATAKAALERIGASLTIERAIRGLGQEGRQAARQKRSAPILEALRLPLDAPARSSAKSALAKAIRYATARWAALIALITSNRRLM